MKFEMKVNGLDGLAAALRALPAEIASKNGGPLVTALRASARVVRNEAKLKATIRTGRLRGSIVVQRDRYPGNVTERLVVRPRAGKSRTDPRGAYYWHFVEFGTESQRAQPFMRPAFDATKDKALTAFKDKLRIGIEKARKRAAAKGLARGR